MLSETEILELISLLEECYPVAYCELEYSKDYQLLFSARLSAQCTDVRVNKVTPILFEKYPTLEALAEARQDDIEEIIHSCGFFRAKARDIIGAADMLLEKYGGRVPDTMEQLLTLPGVGRKTANLILGDIHNLPAVVVDTHCIRLSNRIGLVDTKDTVKIEAELRRELPPEKSSDFCHRLVLHGRAVCMARKPNCGECCIAAVCRTGIAIYS